MLCKKCKNEIPDNAAYCSFCGKKQTVTAAKHRKRAHGTGTIRKDTRYKNPYIAIAPATAHGAGRVYIGSYPDVKTAQAALEAFIRNGRPELYNATLEDIYKIWSETHYKQIAPGTVSTWKSAWKWFRELYNVKVADLHTAHFQEIVNRANTRGTAKWVKTLAHQIMQCAVENDVISRNCVDFVKLPKSEKTEKIIFTAEQIALLWEHSDDKYVQMILAMIYMGFRISELIELQTDNVRIADGYVIGGKKTEAGTDRIIPFPPGIPEIKEFFKRWIGSCAGKRLFDMTASQFRIMHFYRILDEYGMIDAEFNKTTGRWIFHNSDHLTPHSTRHTFASLSSAAGMRPENLQKIIGHANFSTTADVYIHQDIDTLKTEMSKLRK